MTEEPKKEHETPRKMQQLLARAMKDEAWRQELLTNPKTLIERELGITLPQGVTIATHEDTSTTVHLVLPPRQLQAVEVSDPDLLTPGTYGDACTYYFGGCRTVW
jgi:hypothetical protein